MNNQQTKQCPRCLGGKKVYQITTNGYSLINNGGMHIDCPMCLGEGKVKTLEARLREIDINGGNPHFVLISNPDNPIYQEADELLKQNNGQPIMVALDEKSKNQSELLNLIEEAAAHKISTKKRGRPFKKKENTLSGV
jgi:hypothetical protein